MSVTDCPLMHSRQIKDEKNAVERKVRWPLWCRPYDFFQNTTYEKQLSLQLCSTFIKIDSNSVFNCSMTEIQAAEASPARPSAVNPEVPGSILGV